MHGNNTSVTADKGGHKASGLFAPLTFSVFCFASAVGLLHGNSTSVTADERDYKLAVV